MGLDRKDIPFIKTETVRFKKIVTDWLVIKDVTRLVKKEPLPIVAAKKFPTFPWI
jgi:hypothetical protein